MLVLAIVRLLQPVHGYDVRRELLSWHAEDWANVKPGSIYGALNTLQRDGLIAVEGVGQEGARPERTTYRLTPEGEKEFGEMLRESLFSAEQPKNPYFAAVSLFPAAPKEDVVAALRSRILKFEAELLFAEREVTRILAGTGDPAEAEPYHVADAMALQAAHLRADLEWSRKTLERIESGVLDVWDGNFDPKTPRDEAPRQS
ncbi:DNA-binding PadR family transcriptional regulator [Nocardia tenerifensis]|uniref:DNA-binding PadR family transcriptional regulator n=2 Tax=Nocardia tenerifensis TaxID=228006 RepID=A0A318K4B2_9NOCA|nr:PadR family transcriptional regulator [Nocardia tenerifensis]PXX64236.1 DNA-binding PadR family transcriptional regulator [Nocardia tenerifensis]